MGAVWSRYEAQLGERPVATKAVTAMVLGALADVTASRLQGTTFKSKKTAKMALLGLIWSGPSVHFWQGYLGGVVFKGQEQNFGLAVKKTLVDQMIYGPLSNLIIMSWISMVVNGNSSSETIKTVRARLWQVQLAGWRFWPLVSLSSYSFVPIRLRALYANIAAFLWTVYVNSLQNK